MKSSIPLLRRFSCLLAALSACLFTSADTLQTAWTIAPGERTWLTTANQERGLAYNPVTHHVLVVSRTGGNNVWALDAATGADVLREDSTPKSLANGDGILSQGTFIISMIGVSDDGVIYAANLTTGSLSTPFKVYRWANEDAEPTLCYSGDPGEGQAGAVRWGDSFDVRGSGLTTQFIAGAGASTHVAIFTTTDGENFTSKVVANAAPSNGSISVGFGDGNTGWSKRPNSPLRHFSFNLTTGASTLLHTFTINPIASIGFSGKYFGGVAVETPDNVRVYDVSDLSVQPILVGQINTPQDNANGNAVGSVDFGDGKAFFLDTNSGIVAADIVPSATPVSFQAPPANVSVLETGKATLSVIAQGTPPLQFQWFHAGEKLTIPTAQSSILVIPHAAQADAGEYTVEVKNAAGPLTSAPATLTVLPIVSSENLAQIWKINAGDRPYLNDDSYARATAYNKVSGNVLVGHTGPNAATVVVHVLDGATGAEKHLLNLDASIVFGGFFILDRLGVADDGAVYAANLTTGSSSVQYAVYRWENDAADTLPTLVYLGDPSNGVGDIRFGDSFDVRGAGETTQILASSRNGNTVALITPNADTSLATATTIEVADAPAGSMGLSVAFGKGNSFYGTAPGAAVRLVTFDDPAGQTVIPGTVAKVFAGTEIPLTVASIAYDPDSDFLAGIALENPDGVRLYKLDAENNATLIDQELYEVDAANPNGTGSLDFGGGKLFALNSNNGALAFTFTASVQPGRPTLALPERAANGDVIINLTGTINATYTIQATASLTAPIAWTTVGAATMNASGAGQVTDPTGFSPTQRYYRAIFPAPIP